MSQRNKSAFNYLKQGEPTRRKLKYSPAFHCYVCRQLITRKGMCPVEQKDTSVLAKALVLVNTVNTGERHREEKADRLSKRKNQWQFSLCKMTPRQETRFTKPPKASSNQDNITPLPFAQHLSRLESVPANVISTTMLGDLPVYSHNQACCLCTPRSFCSQSEMSLRDQTVTALAPGVLKTFILHSDVIACEC